MREKFHQALQRPRCVAIAILLAAPVFAHRAPAQAEEPLSVSLALRTRNEYIDWTVPSASPLDGKYSFSHLRLRGEVTARSPYVSGTAGVQLFQLAGLPYEAAGPGAAYRALNDGEGAPFGVTLSRLSLTLTPYGEPKPLSLTAGRVGYASGLEHANADPAIEKLKKVRVANRLVGTFDFTGGRAFDGLLLRGSRSGSTPVTASLAAFHPTEGGFATDGTTEISEIDIGLLSLTAEIVPGGGELQLFAGYYTDERAGVVKIDNRPAELRRLDTEAVELKLGGLHVLLPVARGEVASTVLLWGAIEAGRFGDDDLLAGAYAAELSLGLPGAPLAPELLLGWDWASGDGDPTDGDHHTFLPPLPTSRQYARTPFYSSLNLSDLFGAATVKPTDSLELRASVRHLSLVQATDLLYSGSGAVRAEGDFGYGGVLTGSRAIGTLVDVELAYKPVEWLTATIYYGHLHPDPELARALEDAEVDYAYFEVAMSR